MFLLLLLLRLLRIVLWTLAKVLFLWGWQIRGIFFFVVPERTLVAPKGANALEFTYNFTYLSQLSKSRLICRAIVSVRGLLYIGMLPFDFCKFSVDRFRYVSGEIGPIRDRRSTP